MICKGLAMCSGLPPAWSDMPPQSLDTVKPLKPALGLEPRPVAPSSRISPPAPVDAPGKGEIAVGWLWVSTFISTWCRACSL
jgi:hypothetical protein